MRQFRGDAALASLIGKKKRAAIGSEDAYVPPLDHPVEVALPGLVLEDELASLRIARVG